MKQHTIGEFVSENAPTAIMIDKELASEISQYWK